MRAGNRPGLLLGLVVAVAAMALLWALLSPGEGWRPDRIQALGQRFADTAWFPWFIFLLIVGAQQLAVPHLVLVALAVILLGPWQGFAVAYTATVLGALAGYLTGWMFGENLLRRFESPRIDRLDRALARRGVYSVIVVNLFPLLPHVMINLMAGTTRLRLRQFLLGTAAGLLPSTLAIMVITQFLLHFSRMPTAGEAFWALVLTALLVLGVWWLGRLLWRYLDEGS